ncbi:MAG: sigma-70 family RNA polymerase sigma factor [Planctomycetes bacterium]|nr:sigma-70 family RNA polymerase sigma factor [Planctomycetota bacterium]
MQNDHPDPQQIASERRRLARLWMEAMPSVQSFICSAIPRFHDAEDVLQQVAEDVAEHFDRYDADRPFVAWAIGIAKIQIALHYRKSHRDMMQMSDAALERIAVAHVDGHDSLSDRHAALEDCLAGLDDKPRRMLALRYGESLSSDEIAARLASTAKSVRVTLTRLRTRLADCIAAKLHKGGVS